MDEKIFSRFHGAYALYVNDRMSPFNENENRILFEIRQLEGRKSINDVDFFMDIEDARLLAFMLERGAIQKKTFERVRGLRGKARSFNLFVNPKGREEALTLKIDHGTGRTEGSGMTTFLKKTNSLMFDLSWEEALILALNLKERILVNNTAWAMSALAPQPAPIADGYENVFPV